jgi:hypothetical protein
VGRKLARKLARKRARAAADDREEKTTATFDKIARLLALLYVKDVADKEAVALKLDAIGFSAREIAVLLDVGLNYVNVARQRKGKKR